MICYECGTDAPCEGMWFAHKVFVGAGVYASPTCYRCVTKHDMNSSVWRTAKDAIDETIYTKHYVENKGE